MHLVAWLWSRSRDVRGLLSRLVWLRGHLGQLVLATAAGAITFAFFSVPDGDYVAYFGQPSNVGVIIEAVALSALAYSLIAAWSTNHVSVVMERQDNLDEQSIRPDDGMELSAFRDQVIMFSPEVNRLLQSASNRIRFTRRDYEVHPIIRRMLPIFLFKLPEARLDTTDDAKVGLRTDLVPEVLASAEPVFLQKSSYFRDRLSNTLANYRVVLDGRVLLNLRHEAVDSSNRLISLKESKLSNQLGASTLLVTADGAIVFLRQGNRTAENAGRLAPAGSGSFDLPRRFRQLDVSFQDFARSEATRELCQECGLRSEEILAIQICGFGRYLYRNGKPEVFCIASTTRDSHSIAIPVREWDYQQVEVERQPISGALTARNVVQALAQLIERMESRSHGFEAVSGPLYWNAKFALDRLEHISAEDEQALLGNLI